MNINHNRKISIPIYLLILTFLGTSLQAQAFEWAHKLGGTSSDEADCVATDANGNIFVLGRVIDSMDLDPGSGTQMYTSNGGRDLYIQKFTPSGSLIWAHGFGGSGFEDGRQVLTDAAGNCYIAGQFTGTVDFDFGPGAFSMTASGSDDNFILKLSPSGTFQWAKKFGRSGYDGLYTIALDAAGNLYTAGQIRGSTDLDPGPGTANFSSAGNGDIYVQKLDPNGNYLWARVLNGSADDSALSMTIDGQGNLIVTGYFQNSIDFNPGAGTNTLVSKGGTDLFILKLNAAGNFIWAKSIGSSVDDEMGKSITTDLNDNLFLTGYFSGTTDFNPDAGVNSLTAGADQDMFILKLSSAGTYQWAHGFGGGPLEWGGTVVTDQVGDVYVTGKFWGTVDFNPGPGVLNFTASSALGSVLLKFKTNGQLDWGLHIPGQIPLFRNELALDDNGNILVAGKFLGTSDFDPGSGVSNLTATGGYDGYILKLGSSIPCTPSNVSIAPTACGSYMAPDSVVYTASGNYTATLTNSDGCDSIISIALTINQANSATDTQTACGSYTWIDGVNYTSSNNSATFTLTNAQGCDSVVTLDLTINQANSATDTQTACGSYTWIDGVTYTSSNNSATFTLTNAQGCDSVVTLDLTINQASTATDTQTACDSYTWIDGVTYTSSNNSATFTLTNAQGCDSVVTLDLTISTVDVGVTNNAPTLSANATGAGVAYQWLDCNNAWAPIAGATSQDFTPSANGDYAVEISANGCVDTSACTNVVVVSTDPYGPDLHAGIEVYPNPTSGRINVSMAARYEVVRLRIFNALGQLTSEKVGMNVSEMEVEILEHAGIYFMEIQVEGGAPQIIRINKQ